MTRIKKTQINDPNLTHPIRNKSKFYYIKQVVTQLQKTFIVPSQRKDLSLQSFKLKLRTLYQPTYPQNDICG
ncbi:hypothetical protein VH1807_contig00043-0101 [Vibrio harveyi]|nr:hypothetical protein VH1807_contig00043-0101 [Vibrio harveyi]